MPYFLVAAGIVLLVTAVQNTYATLGSLLQSDFTGQGNFIFWVAAIVIIGAIGYYAPFRPISRGLLILTIIVMVISNGGFAQQFTAAIQSGPQLPTPAPILSPTTTTASTSVLGALAGAGVNAAISAL
jgi:hypothetical protein